jgi:hypothetical protein
VTFHDSLTHIPDPEVVPKARRRKFLAEYKLRILDESVTCCYRPLSLIEIGPIPAK